MKLHSCLRGSQPLTHVDCAMLQSARFRRRKCHAQLRCSASKSRSGASVMIKICGVTTAEDAKLAAEAGADYVGMIMWPRAKRSVDDETARAIADAARGYGAEPVGVFVDEDAATIARRCQTVGLRTAQLHGAACRSDLDAIPDDLDVVFVLHARPDGELASELPCTDGGGGRRRSVQWVLIDGLKGGSGEAFDWSALQPPEGLAASGWLLAGGLHPGNVAEAIRTAAPTAVDVSSGVCGPDGLRKDPERIMAFVDAVRAAGREE